MATTQYSGPDRCPRVERCWRRRERVTAAGASLAGRAAPRFMPTEWRSAESGAVKPATSSRWPCWNSTRYSPGALDPRVVGVRHPDRAAAVPARAPSQSGRHDRRARGLLVGKPTVVAQRLHRESTPGVHRPGPGPRAGSPTAPAPAAPSAPPATRTAPASGHFAQSLAQPCCASDVQATTRPSPYCQCASSGWPRSVSSAVTARSLRVVAT